MFSVIIPTYNRAHSICDTLDSVKAQSYRPIEIIVVDDGSTDETEAVVRSWQLAVGSEQVAEGGKRKAEGGGQKSEGGETKNHTAVSRPSNLTDSRTHSLTDSPPQTHPPSPTTPHPPPLTLNYIRQENAGAPAARNRGLAEATGDYIQFLDSDDRLHPERFSMLAQVFEEQDADFIQTSIEWFDPESGATVNTLWARPDEDQLQLIVQGDFWANTLRACMRRELALQIPAWHAEMTCFQDRVYMETAVMQAKKPMAIKPILGYLARGEGMHVSNKHRSFEGRKWRIFCERKLVEEVLKHSGITPQQRSMLASRIYRVGCRSAARGWYAYAKECAEIGDLLGASLSMTMRIKRMLCRMGSIGGYLYRLMDRIKFTLLRQERPQY